MWRKLAWTFGMVGDVVGWGFRPRVRWESVAALATATTRGMTGGGGLRARRRRNSDDTTHLSHRLAASLGCCTHLFHLGLAHPLANRGLDVHLARRRSGPPLGFRVGSDGGSNLGTAWGGGRNAGRPFDTTRTTQGDTGVRFAQANAELGRTGSQVGTRAHFPYPPYPSPCLCLAETLD